jgi:hypothetical protein
MPPLRLPRISVRDALTKTLAPGPAPAGNPDPACTPTPAGTPTPPAAAPAAATVPAPTPMPPWPVTPGLSSAEFSRGGKGGKDDDDDHEEFTCHRRLLSRPPIGSGPDAAASCLGDCRDGAGQRDRRGHSEADPMHAMALRFASTRSSCIRLRLARERVTRGRGNKKIRDQPHALEPIVSEEIALGSEPVGRLSICENYTGNRISH